MSFKFNDFMGFNYVFGKPKARQQTKGSSQQKPILPVWAVQLQKEHPLSAKVIDAMVRSGESEATVKDWLDWNE